jgi:transposase
MPPPADPKIKEECLRRMRNGESPSAVARTYGLNEGTVRTWKTRDGKTGSAAVEPTSITSPGEKTPKEAARELTVRIRHNLENVWALVVQAWETEAWRHMGYGSWDDYVAGEFGTGRWRIPRSERGPVVEMLRGAGMSVRAIAAATGESKSTVARAVASPVPDGTPAPPAVKEGTDGKTDPAEPEETAEHPGVAAVRRELAARAEQISTRVPAPGEETSPAAESKVLVINGHAYTVKDPYDYDEMHHIRARQWVDRQVKATETTNLLLDRTIIRLAHLQELGLTGKAASMYGGHSVTLETIRQAQVALAEIAEAWGNRPAANSH